MESQSDEEKERRAFKKVCKDSDPAVLYKSLLESDTNWIFGRDNDVTRSAQLYNKLKVAVAKHFNTKPKDVCIVGTAKTRFSLNPKKNFRSFTDDSDIDLVIVSEDYFEKLWKAYVEYHYQRIFGVDLGDMYYDVFRQFLTIYYLPPNHSMFRQWSKSLGQLSSDLERQFGLYSTIKFRLYRNWEAVQGYHLDGLRTIKLRLQKEHAR